MRMAGFAGQREPAPPRDVLWLGTRSAEENADTLRIGRTRRVRQHDRSGAVGLASPAARPGRARRPARHWTLIGKHTMGVLVVVPAAGHERRVCQAFVRHSSWDTAAFQSQVLGLRMNKVFLAFTSAGR